MAQIKYIDQQGLQQAIAALKGKTDAAYLAKDGVAEAAKKLEAAVKINGVDFDGSAAITVKAEPEDHEHVMADVTDLQDAMDEKVDKVADHSLVANADIAKIHEHNNKAELDKVVDGKVDAWDAKLGVNDADKLVYSNNGMSGVANVKGALDLLANVNQAMVEDIEEVKEAIGQAADAGAQVEASGLHKVIADADAVVLAAAKQDAADQIAALINSAPEAMNTLKELADAIGAHQTVYDAYVVEVAQDIADAKAAAEAKAAELDGVLAGRIQALENAEKDTHVALSQAEIEAAINNAWV
jgi:hypothetical protein